MFFLLDNLKTALLEWLLEYNKSWDFASNYYYFKKLPKKRQAKKIFKTHQTPFYLADIDVLTKQFNSLSKSLKKNWGPHLIAFSVKTNYDVANHKVFKSLGGGVDVVSEKELVLVKKAGYKKEQILINGPHKSDEQLKTAINNGNLIIIENLDEIKKIVKLAQKKKKISQVGIRLNNGRSRFGFKPGSDTTQQALEILLNNKYINFCALHIHTQGDTDNPRSYAKAAQRLVDFIETSIPDHKQNIKFVDVGGGFPANRPKPFYKKTWNPQPVDAYIYTIAETLKSCFINERPTIVVEPGRFLVDDAVYFVAQVVHNKTENERQIIRINSSLTMLPLCDYCPQIIFPYSQKLTRKTNPLLETEIFGISSREDDVMYRGQFPACEVGDYVIFYSTGAYNKNMSADFIYDKPPTIFF